MKRTFLFCVMMFALVLAEGLNAQEKELPVLLNEAGHCLVTSTQDWLGLAKSPAQWGRFGWIDDRKSSPGERHMFLLVRLDTNTAQLFDIRVESRHGKHILTLENRFELSSTGDNDTFVNSPAGGPRIARLYQDAISNIRRRTVYHVQLSRFRAPVMNLVCGTEI